MSYEFDPELEMDEDGEWIDEESYERFKREREELRIIGEFFPKWRAKQDNEDDDDDEFYVVMPEEKPD